ncbi:hypothetical protein ACPPVU_09100 [Mucilaginibacter sp. McL0603]|uniref:hypothetical protein n=1 Tax=Mucilaginibacter sp. McL0603 TaxID=3415670 RepID=UPI003CEAC92C
MLLNISEDLGALASVSQAFIALGALVCFYWTFKLQTYTFEEQLKVSKAQLKLLEIETIRHRKEIMPQFKMAYSKTPYKMPSTPEGKYLLHLSFELNENPVRDFRMKITEAVNFESYNPFPSGNMNAKWQFGLQFLFGSNDGTIPSKTPNQSHLIFKLDFKDIKGNEYEQTTVFVPHLTETSFSNEPVLIKAVDLIN